MIFGANAKPNVSITELRRTEVKRGKRKMTMMATEDEKFMRMALEEAGDALGQGQFPVGCVIVCDQDVVATGGRKNCDAAFSEIDHAEIVALRDLQKHRPDIDRSRLTVYATMEPCLMCFSTLIVNGIHRVVYAYEDAMGGGTNIPLAQLAPLYATYSMEVVAGVMRRESLRLFQRFFRTAGNDYLQDTLLARYTLEQP